MEEDEEPTNNEDLIEVDVSDDLPFDEDDLSETAEDKIDEQLEDVVETAILTFDVHTDSVYSSAINPKIPGLIVTGGGDDLAYLFRYSCSGDGPEEGTIYHAIELSGHTDTVCTVGFNFDGTLTLTGSYDGTVRIWDSSTGELKQALSGPEDIEWAEFHSKGNAVVAGSKDGTIWMWMAHNGQCIQVFAGHDGGVSSGCFTKDGKAICSGGEDGSVRIWAPKTGQCKHVFEGHFGHAAMVTCLVSSDDGDMILSGMCTAIVIYVCTCIVAMMRHSNMLDFRLF